MWTFERSDLSEDSNWQVILLRDQKHPSLQWEMCYFITVIIWCRIYESRMVKGSWVTEIIVCTDAEKLFRPSINIHPDKFDHKWSMIGKRSQLALKCSHLSMHISMPGARKVCGLRRTFLSLVRGLTQHIILMQVDCSKMATNISTLGKHYSHSRDPRDWEERESEPIIHVCQTNWECNISAIHVT